MRPGRLITAIFKQPFWSQKKKRKKPSSEASVTGSKRSDFGMKELKGENRESACFVSLVQSPLQSWGNNRRTQTMHCVVCLRASYRTARRATGSSVALRGAKRMVLATGNGGGGCGSLDVGKPAEQYGDA
jgi:hypothetical protein